MGTYRGDLHGRHPSRYGGRAHVPALTRPRRPVSAGWGMCSSWSRFAEPRRPSPPCLRGWTPYRPTWAVGPGAGSSPPAGALHGGVRPGRGGPGNGGSGGSGRVLRLALCRRHPVRGLTPRRWCCRRDPASRDGIATAGRAGVVRRGSVHRARHRLTPRPGSGAMLAIRGHRAADGALGVGWPPRSAGDAAAAAWRGSGDPAVRARRAGPGAGPASLGQRPRLGAPLHGTRAALLAALNWLSPLYVAAGERRAGRLLLGMLSFTRSSGPGRPALPTAPATTGLVALCVGTPRSARHLRTGADRPPWLWAALLGRRRRM